MKRHLLAVALAAAAMPAVPAQAQGAPAGTAPADTGAYPKGIKPARHGTGEILVDARGHTLYMYNANVARGRSGEPLKYCVGACTQVWAPLRPAAGAAPTGRWTVVEGAEGPQWALRGNPVFTFRADAAPGATGGEGYDDLWYMVPYVPPAPKLVAPPVVKPAYRDGRYILADASGHALYTAATNACGDACAGWTPLEAGMAARPIGEWAVARMGDRAHWTYRGRPVFVVEADAAVPAAGAMLTP